MTGVWAIAAPCSKGGALTIHYRTITVYTSEEARWKGRPLHDVVVKRVRGRKIAARSWKSSLW